MDERLAALLVSALALLMLAGAISAAGRVVEKSRMTLTQYYAAEAGLATHTDDAGIINVTIRDQSVENRLFDQQYSVTSFVNDELGKRKVASYALPPEASGDLSGG